MTKKQMTHQEEYDFYADPQNQRPRGPARRRTARLTEMVPVRFPSDTLAAVRERADGEDRSVSNWIRRAVERELSSDATDATETTQPRSRRTRKSAS
ncbi:MAG: CopG family transcriptional regulator [Actinomycetota bacterium]|nr:CopG family transcriptional regulator [Actinomycetota bacterium]